MTTRSGLKNISIQFKTYECLKNLKVHKNQSFDEVIQSLIFGIREETETSKKSVGDIRRGDV